MALTQDGRMMNIQTPLGKDVLLINSFTAEEEMSRLYSVVAELVHEGAPGGGAPHVVAPNTILGKNVCINVTQRDGTERFFNGIVNRFEQRNRDGRFTHYEAEIVPNFWLLSQRKQSRIFQHKTVPQIVEAVFKGLNYSLKLQGSYEKRNFCVQYRETDLDFAMRLMEEEGIFFYFEHSASMHKMIIGDHVGAYNQCPGNSSFTWDLKQPGQEDFIATIRAWIVNHRMQTGKVTFWDHNFELPYNKLDASQPTLFSLENKDKLEVYDYPGGYSRKYDGIDKSGGEQSSELNKVFQDKAKTASIAMEEIDARYQIITGAGDYSSMTAGHRFSLVNHPVSDGAYVLTSVSHTATQSPDYASEDTVLDPYDNSFTCIPVTGVTFRPGQITPKPTVEGVQTATVVGPAGEEIFTDKYGRIKVQFHWDRHGQNDADSSCWVRVAQNWAGKKWGVMFIPRIGMEVMISFIEGDPDRPIITGCVYNADTMPPYALPDNKTRSTIKSNSSKGGGGFNEFRIEDKKGEEQIFIHAEKDLDIRVKNDKKEIIKNDRHVIVEKNSFEEGKGDSHSKLTGDNNTEMGGSASLKVGGDIDAKVGGKVAVDAGSEIHLKAGMKIIIEAGVQISLKAGGSFIDIGPAGVSIKGAMVNINSGGSPGSGSGASTTAPTAPKEAVDDKAGEAAAKAGASSPPPDQPLTPGAGAAGMSGAAASGAPTVGGGSGGSGSGSAGAAPDQGGGGTGGGVAGDAHDQGGGGTGGGVAGSAPSGTGAGAGQSGDGSDSPGGANAGRHEGGVVGSGSEGGGNASSGTGAGAGQGGDVSDSPGGANAGRHEGGVVGSGSEGGGSQTADAGTAAGENSQSDSAGGANAGRHEGGVVGSGSEGGGSASSGTGSTGGQAGQHNQDPGGGGQQGAGAGDGSTSGRNKHSQTNPDGSSEIRHPDGTVETTAADGTKTTTHTDGSKEYRYPDGSTATETTDGTRTVTYPDGTSKTTYPEGGSVTRNPDGSKDIEWS